MSLYRVPYGTLGQAVNMTTGAAVYTMHNRDHDAFVLAMFEVLTEDQQHRVLEKLGAKVVTRPVPPKLEA